MKRKFTFLIAAALMLLTMMATTGTMWGQTDVIDHDATNSNLGNTGTTSWATNFSITGTSGAIYYIHSMGTKNTTNALQWNTNGFMNMTTTSTGKKLKSVTITTTANKNINLYASNTAFSTSTPSGTALATIAATSSGTTYTFNGDYTYLALKGTTSSTSITSISIEWETPSSVATPTFSPAAGTYPEAQNVTINCTTENTTIYYTTDGSTPDNTKTQYTGAINVTATTTIKAIAYDNSNNASSVATATYTIVTPFTTMEQIFADATANTSAHQVFITFDNWVITGNNGNNPTTAFLSDGTNGCRIYNNSGVGFAKGNILSGTTSCNLSLYYGMAQLNLTSAASGLNIQTGGEVIPVVTTIDALTGIKAGSVVTLQGLTYNGSNLTDGENSITPYTYMYSASLATDHVYNVTGVFEYGYNSVKRINPRDENDIEEVIITTPTISASNVDIECTATGGEIAYTINNPVDGGSISATTQSDWLNLSNNFESPIAFTCSSNTATEERSATVTLTYSYNAKATVTKNVTVTQAAYEASNVTWDLSIASYDSNPTANLVTWSSTYATMTNAKGTSSNNANNYLGGDANNRTSTRFYTNQILTITPATSYAITSIEFTATSTNYATTLKNSTWTNATAAVNNTIVTVTPTDGTTAISAVIGGTCGFTSVKVYYTESSDPSVATTVTIDASGITNTDVSTSTAAGSLNATVHAGENLIDGASVTWVSSNTDAATIDENGVVTLIAAGTTTITASYAGVENQYKPSSATYELTVIDSNAPGTENNPYTVADAMAAIDAQGTINEAYVTGIVSQVDSYNSSYHSITYWISDDGETTTQLEVYSGKGLNGADFSSVADVQVGATVVVKGKLKLYNQTYEFDYNNELVSYTAPVVTVEAPTFSVAAGGYAEAQTVEITCATEGATIKYSYDNENWNDYSEALTINETKTVYAKAIKDANESSVSSATYYILSNDNNYTVTQALNFAEYPQNNVFVHGIVSTAPTSLLDGGLLTYYISVDGTENNRLQVYKGKNLDNIEFTAADNIQVGDVVTIFGNVKVYNNQKEFDQGNYLVTWERLETVATPTFTPAEGEYTEAQSVIIACTTDDATIYYKTAENEEWAVYSEAIDVDETTTIWAYAAKEGMNSSAVATATYTINIPVFTPSITVDPALVEATAEGGDGTLTVTYENITEILAQVYFCDENGDAAEYNWITAEINNENNVEYLIVENEGEARTAYFKVYAMDNNTELVYSNLVTISQAAYVEPSQEVTDVLDLAFTGVSGTSYSDWSDKTGTSGAVYAGNSAGGNDAIQLRSKNSSGIVTTTSGGKVTKVEVTWNDNTSSGRKLDIYGKNTAYSEVSDLYNNENQGTKLGTIEYDDNEPLIISGDYEFIGIRSNDGALYLDEIQITWSTTPAGPSITVTPAEITDVSAAGDIPEHTVILANLNISSTDDFLFAYCDLEGNILGNTDPKPNWIELAEAEYTATGENVYSMVYTVAANEETTPRTGYFKIGIEQATETVYSNIVTVTQLGYVTPVATITVVPNEVLDVPAEGDVYVHTVTLENMTVESTDDFTLAFCDENGEVLDEQAPKPDWIEIGDVEFAVTSEENVYSLTYPVAENTETTPRTAYFKVAATQTSEAVYSNLVTVTQDGYVPPVVADNYELFSGDLVEGDYLIVYDGVAMNNTLSGKRFGYDEVTITNNTISNSSNTIVWHIAPSATEGYWTLFNVEEEKYASNGGTSMDMSLSTTSDNDNTLWSVTAPGETTHEFRNKSNESQSARYLRRNTTYGFACYSTSTGGALSLYKKVDNTPSISFNGSSANIGTYPTGEEITWGNIIVSQHNLTENISLSADKGTVTPNSIDAGADPTEVVWSYTPTIADYTTATITATSGTVEATFVIQFVAKTPHNINIASVENGTIAVVGGKETEIEGENVDFTVTPDEGYVIDEITVMAGETPVDYIQGETFYRFQMPDSDVTISATFTETVTDDYELFSGDLVEGDYLIVYDGVAMNNTLSGKRFGYDEVTITNNTISNSSNTIVWHIAPSATEGYWTLFNVEEEKYASNGGTSMDMSLSTTSDNDNTLWSVTAPGETTHEFRNKSNESQSARYLRRNTTYGFACYSTSTGGALSLYKKVDNTPSISFNGSSANIGTYPTGEEITWGNIIVSQHNLTENISLSADKGTVTPNSIDAGADPTEVVWSYTPTIADYTTATITATSGTVEATFVIQFVAKTPHNINIASVENGTIAVVGGKETEIEGENVDFTVTPDEGYVIDEITVMAGETPVDYIQGETFYRFQMPDSDVTINATFNELPKYTITFRVNGLPDESLTIENIVLGNSTILPTTSDNTPAGFAISGWSEENSTIAVADPYYPTATVTLYAMLQLENAPTASGDYVKVTEPLTDWSGEYLIVYEDGNVAFDGSLTTLDANGNTYAVTITNNTIEATTTTNASKFTITALSEGGYSIQSASGYFIGQTTDDNGLASSTTNAYTNSISFDTENNYVNVISSGGAYLRYNSDANRFRYYKSSSYTNQKAIQLYKKETTSFNYVEILNNIEPEQTWTGPIPESTCLVVPENVVLTYSGPNPSVPEALVIQDGGQLIHESAVNATIQRSIDGYSSKSGSGWYFIASPADGVSTSGLITTPATSYDLYKYNEPNAYWYSNHGANAPFTTLERGIGYLYANTSNIALDFAGEMVGTQTEVTKTLSFKCDPYPDLKGYNLMGNPFTRNIGQGDITLGGEPVTSVLLLNNDSEYQTCNFLESGVIKPGQGFFIQATANDQELVFNPSSSKDVNEIGLISIKAGDENYIDKAYIQFDGGNTLRKMTLTGDKSQVYVMHHYEDYAAARLYSTTGSVPVNFEAAYEGIFTITIETKNLDLETLRLIDNMTGDEIDLLAESSYTFKANSDEPAERFTLLFEKSILGIDENAENEVFAYQFDDEILVSGEGTLQVFDVMGRYVASYEVNGSKRISTSLFNAGVYIFKMNGEKNMTQKIVVR